MTYERVALRLNADDVTNLTAVADALNRQRPSSNPWDRSASITNCLRLALKVAAEAAVRGDLTEAKGRGNAAEQAGTVN